MKKASLFIGVGGLTLILIGSVISPQKRVIWNRTDSAPTGIYWVQNMQPRKRDLVIVSAGSEAATWAQTHGAVGEDWPLLKSVVGQTGDRICRLNGQIFINQKLEATAQTRTSQGLKLPEWTGCRTLLKHEVFLLNPHPKSLDGRYFGPTKIDDLDGVAVLLFSVN